jgi:hypothetical protein
MKTFKPYLFYLEKRDDATGVGPLLKYGHKGKPITHVLDLGYRPVDNTEGLNGVLVVRKANSKKNQFKIITSEETIRLVAETPDERDSWI